jgi:tetratricopeptide (TPR) repeat protein
MTRLVCLCILAVSLLAWCGCSASKQSLVAKGNHLFAAGKYEEAELNYRAAIDKDRLYGDAYLGLALTSVKLNQVRTAFTASLRAAQLLPDNIEAKRNLAEVCLSLYLADSSHPQLLYNQINKISDEFISQDPHSYEGWMLKGYLASTDRKPKEAIADFRQALAANPSNDGVMTELAHLLIQDGEVPEGQRLAMNLIGKKTTYGPAYDLMFNFYRSANQTRMAESVLEAKASNNPKNATYLLELAGYYESARNVAAMNAVLERLLDDPKDFPEARLWIGDFYLRRRNYTEAIRYYQQGRNSSRESKTKVTYEMRNVFALAAQGKTADALSLAAEFLRENPKEPGLLRAHADLLLSQGRNQDADVVVREFKTLAAANPADASLRMQLGRALRLAGDLEEARNQFLEAVRAGQDVREAHYQLAAIALLQHRPQEAVAQAQQILNKQPKDRQARLAYTNALIAAGDVETARAMLDGLHKDFPHDPQVQAQSGFEAVAEKNFPQAIKVFEEDRSSADPRTIEALASAYLHERQFDRARGVLSDALQKWPDSAALQEELADTETLSGHYDLALADYHKILARDSKSIDLCRRIAEFYELQGELDRAIPYYEQAHRLVPADVAAALSLADALSRTGRVAEARSLYQSVAQAHPDNAPALNNAAFFLADTGGDLDQALRLAKNALDKVPGQPSFSDTLGYIYLKKGLLDSAIQSFSALARKYPASASFRYHLGLALFEKGEKSGARRELEAALANHPSAQETTRIRELLHEIG